MIFVSTISYQAVTGNVAGGERCNLATVLRDSCRPVTPTLRHGDGDSLHCADCYHRYTSLFSQGSDSGASRASEVMIEATVKLQLDLFSNNFDRWKPIRLFLYKERLNYLIRREKEGQP